VWEHLPSGRVTHRFELVVFVATLAVEVSSRGGGI
jgi:hypothetical protein